MFIVEILYKTVLDALFPLPPAAEEVLSYTPEQALQKLPPAPRPPIAAFSVFAYKDQRVTQLVWLIKYKKSAQAAAIGGYALRNKLRTIAGRLDMVIVPMPIHKKRRRERGFNQCELLTDEITRLDKDRRQFIVEKDLLKRIHYTSRHTLKNREERLEDAKGLFEADKKLAEKYKDSIVVVIDDVITTGGTMIDATNTLKSTGVKRVLGMSLAH